MGSVSRVGIDAAGIVGQAEGVIKIANAACFDTIQRRGKFEDGTLYERPHSELDRLQRSPAGRYVDDCIAPERKHAGADLAADDLLLVGDDVDNLEGFGVHQTQIDSDIHHIHAAVENAGRIRIDAVATEDINALGSNIEIQFGDAANQMKV